MKSLRKEVSLAYIYIYIDIDIKQFNKSPFVECFRFAEFLVLILIIIIIIHNPRRYCMTK